MPPRPGKSLGKPGSLNAPIAAFTMAIILCSYCFSSIRTARREAHASAASPPVGQSNSNNVRISADRLEQPSWVQQALEEKRNSK